MIANVIMGLAVPLIERLFPDPNQAAEAKLKLLEMQQRGELAALEADLELAKGQMAINQEEAASSDPFRAGWRPFIGWTCGSAFAFNFVILPLIMAISAFNGNTIILEPLDMSEMLPVLLGMLGLGGFRTYEKIKGNK